MSKRKITGRRKSITTSLFSESNALMTSDRSTKLSASNELSKLSFQSVSEPKGIQFGSATGSRQTSTGGSGGGLVSDLLRTGASSGVKSLFSSGLVGLFGGSLISGIAGLFGGAEESPAPLVSFGLPDAQSRTIDVGGAARFQGSQSSSSSAPSGSLYSDRNGEIVRAVKQALLTSNQLSDIISEL